MLYRVLRAIIWLGIRLYYREIKVVNRGVLNQMGPKIIIANHPNTLMDAWIMGYVNKRKVYFMAKATFFNSPFKRKLLHALGMIPINRQSDGATAGISNKDSFEACYRLLEQGECLVVFPEGTSYLERQLRELKTGTARIALEVEKRNKGNLHLKVIPIGLNYVAADSFRGRVMVHIGKPIDLEQYWPRYELNQGEAARELTDRFRTELSRVFISMDNDLKEQLGEQLRVLFDTRYRRERDGVQSTIALFKSINERLDEYAVTTPWKITEIQQETTDLLARLESLGIRPDYLDRTYRSVLYTRQFFQSILFLICTFPLFVTGFILHFIPYYGIGKWVPRITNEVEYHAPITILIGFLAYPLCYAGWIYGCSKWLPISWGSIGLLIILLPILGLFTHFYMRYIAHLKSKQRFSRFARKRSAIFKQLKDERKALQTMIFED
jgi:1-acyl-sn-glycerol-3-phosphate acyltransferase